jgi:hypothetical protein
MNDALQLFGFLVLAFLGIVAPIFIILLSVFREGALMLTNQYEMEDKQNQAKIREELEASKQPTEPELSTVLEKTLQKLKTQKKRIRRKLFYLDPTRQILTLFGPFLFSFLCVLLATLLGGTGLWQLLFVLVSVISFGGALYFFQELLKVVIEARKLIDDKESERNTKIIQLMSIVAEKITQQEQITFLKKVHIIIDDVSIMDDSNTITMLVNKMQKLKIGIRNSESIMANDIEIGFEFSSDFIIEKLKSYAFYSDSTKQIVRSYTTRLHAETYLLLGEPLTFTPIKVGKFSIVTWVKAQNIKPERHKVSINVEKPSELEQISQILSEMKDKLGR